MAQRIVVAALVRNEADRWLRPALRAWRTFADEILILDDSSTDATIAVAHEEGATVYERETAFPAWGTEAPARRQLWSLAAEFDADWIFILDADMVPARDPRPLFHPNVDAVAFGLYDLWSVDPLRYRGDGFWQAHSCPRVWAVHRRATPSDAEWSDRGIHCGHFPSNLRLSRIVHAPNSFGLLHYGYATEPIRAEKLARYAAVQSQLSEFERAHARSIADAAPSLFALPFVPEMTL